ncbi:hypothetical protein K438DRAFT_1978359 [Mycena galopus ATCC 62051]|nr:hypothetical protein K438DRAFT_1978359 [Mycena galopus ATCC 62051]
MPALMLLAPATVITTKKRKLSVPATKQIEMSVGPTFTGTGATAVTAKDFLKDINLVYGVRALTDSAAELEDVSHCFRVGSPADVWYQALTFADWNTFVVTFKKHFAGIKPHLIFVPPPSQDPESVRRHWRCSTTAVNCLNSNSTLHGMPYDLDNPVTLMAPVPHDETPTTNPNAPAAASAPVPCRVTCTSARGGNGKGKGKVKEEDDHEDSFDSNKFESEDSLSPPPSKKVSIAVPASPGSTSPSRRTAPEQCRPASPRSEHQKNSSRVTLLYQGHNPDSAS